MQLARPQVGFVLFEALMALLILTVGVLGLLWMHQHALVLQRQQLMRSVAMGIAQDLSERMHMNPQSPTLYAKPWGNSHEAASVDCTAKPCNRDDLAKWDLQQLRQALQTQLPEGDAAVFALSESPDWWGVVVAWRDANETYRTDTTTNAAPCPAQMSCWRLFFKPTR